MFPLLKIGEDGYAKFWYINHITNTPINFD